MHSLSWMNLILYLTQFSPGLHLVNLACRLYSFDVESVILLATPVFFLIPRVYKNVIGEDEYRLIKVNLEYPIPHIIKHN